MDRHIGTIAAMAAASAICLAGAAQAVAADLLTYGQYRGETARSYHPPKPYKHYRAARYEVCEQLQVRYRAPYEPRKEIVTLCHPPLNWD